MRPFVEAGEIAPTPEPLIEALVVGPVAAVSHRRLSGAHDVDLARTARIFRTASGVRSARSDGRAGPVRVTSSASRTGGAQRPAETASPVGTVNVTAAAATVTSASLPRA
ncbi:hypothetical protein GCM10018791_22600 [Streptomyces zaomyceticus]|nr:hypothetical protein GCM10018791_22600 [Streptomyces zaomyceticus]